MPIETCRATNWTGTGTTNPSNAVGDNNNTTYATVTATGTRLADVTRTGTSSTWGTKSQTWSDYEIVVENLYATISAVNWGGGGILVWAQYSTNGGSSWTTFGSGPVSDPLDTGTYTSLTSGTISGDPTLSNIQVRVQITSYAGDSGSFTPGDVCDAYVGEIYLNGTYTSAPTVTSLNAGSYCNIGSSYDIVGTNFTSASSVSIAGVSASYSVTNSTTISVTIPPIYLTSNLTNQSVSVTTPGGTGSANVGNITCPGVAAISPAITSITAGGTQAFSTTITNITPTTAHWYASSGSMSTTTSNPSTWTSPSSPLSDGYSTSISVWPDANNTHGVPVASLSVPVYYAPIATSLTYGTRSVASGGTTSLTPVFSYGSAHAYIGTTNGGTQVTASAVTSTPYTSTSIVADTTFYLHVQNVPGSTASVSTTVYLLPTISSFTRSPAILTNGSPVTLSGTFTVAGSGKIGTTAGGSDVTNNALSGFNYSAYPTSDQTYYLRVQNSVGDYVDSNVSVGVVGAPIATSLVPSTTSPLYGATITLTPTFSIGAPGGSTLGYIGSGGVGTSDVTASSSSGVGVSSAAITSATTFTLTVYNYASSPSSANTSTSVVTPQTVTVADISPLYVTKTEVKRAGNTFTSSVGGASNTGITWSFGGVGTITSGQNTNTVTWTAPNTPQTVTITATSQADGVTQKTLSYKVVNGTKKASASS